MKVNMTGGTDPHCCEQCGKVAELRPFGPKGESICFECGMKDPKTTEAMFMLRLEQGAISVEDLGAILNRVATLS